MEQKRISKFVSDIFFNNQLQIYTTNKLAELLGVSNSTITLVKNANRNFSPEILQRFFLLVCQTDKTQIKKIEEKIKDIKAKNKEINAKNKEIDAKNKEIDEKQNLKEKISYKDYKEILFNNADPDKLVGLITTFFNLEELKKRIIVANPPTSESEKLYLDNLSKKRNDYEIWTFSDVLGESLQDFKHAERDINYILKYNVKYRWFVPNTSDGNRMCQLSIRNLKKEFNNNNTEIKLNDYIHFYQIPDVVFLSRVRIYDALVNPKANYNIGGTTRDSVKLVPAFEANKIKERLNSILLIEQFNPENIYEGVTDKNTGIHIKKINIEKIMKED